MFSASSFNALLKTLEEPPPHVKFLLATTDPQKLPITVLSRCLQFNLKRLSPTQIKEQLLKILLAEGIAHEVEALWPLAQAADGSMRDGLSLLDQAIAFGGGQVTEAEVRTMLGTLTSGMILDLGEALANGSPAQMLQVVAHMAEHMPDFAGILAAMLNLLHDLAVGQAVPEFLQRDGADNPRKLHLARTLSAEDIQLFYQIGILGQRDLELAPDPRMGLEMVLLRMLAFRPADLANQAVMRPPKLQQPSAHQPSSTPQRPPIATPPQIPPLAATIAPPVSSVVAPQAPSRLDNNEAWHNLVNRLKLGGLAGQLAINCEFGSWDGRTLNLGLDATVATLKVANTEEKMLNALRQQLGPEMQMNLRVTRTAAETPAQRGVREQQQRQQEYQNSFMADPIVRNLQDTFQAEIVPDSIRPTGPKT
jgi:DNA polymerase-3 subunit gamma/tau